jgi:predicted HicB family RNase H-like nuclease
MADAPRGPTATFRLDKEAYQHAKRQADAAGLSVQEWLQRSLDAHARKMFPDAFKDR